MIKTISKVVKKKPNWIDIVKVDSWNININFSQTFSYDNSDKIILQYMVYNNNLIVKNLDIILYQSTNYVDWLYSRD